MEYMVAMEQAWKIITTQEGTSGSRVCADVLLGLYNGSKFPFDLTDLKLLSADNQNVLLNLIAGNLQSEHEIHVDIAAVYGWDAWNEFLEANK